MTRFFATAVDDAMAYEVCCSVCKRKAQIRKRWQGSNLNTMQVTLLLRKWGWHIAGKPQGDVCNNCLASHANSNHPVKSLGHVREVVMSNVNTVSSPVPVSQAVKPSAEVIAIAGSVPSATREARRMIYARIDTNYDPKNGAYTNGKTDAIIAKELNVPLAWVKDVRDENFGPEGFDDQTMKLVMAAMDLLDKSSKDASALLLAHKELTARIQSLQEGLAKLEKLYR